MRKVLSLLSAAVVVVSLTVEASAVQVSAAGGVGLAIQPLAEVRSLAFPVANGSAVAVNASGQIVGTSEDAGRDQRPHGFLTDPTNTDVTRLDTIGEPLDFSTADLTFAFGLNNAGIAVGESTPVLGDNAPLLAVVWDTSGFATDLGTIGNRSCTLSDQQLFNCDFSAATGINNTGTAVGVSDRDDGSGGRIHHTFADTLATLTMTDLGTLPGGANSSASGVNDAGVVVGNSETTGGGAGLTTHAFADDLARHTMRDLGTLPGGTSSTATAVNAAGLVVGSSTVTGGATHPFAYNVARHKIKDLGLPPGATSAGATAVNDDGVVVGNSDAGPWVYEPVSMTFTMIPGADSATGINDSGEIVGHGQVPDSGFGLTDLVPGPYRTFIQPPTVVPGTGSVVEGNKGTRTLRVPVTLANTYTQTVTVQWNTLYDASAPTGQADPATDYTPASGTVTFAPGQTSKTVTIQVDGDTLVEPDEYVIVAFHDPTNAVMGGFYGLGFGIITNDD